MGDTINDGNRRARLAAMAEGGTAGVEAFDSAQAASRRFQQEAVKSALSTGWHPGNALVAADLAGQAQGWTAPYVRDAELGSTLAGEQVGYDRQAYDSYLRRGEEALDLRRQGMAHERRMSSYSDRLRDAEHAERLRSTRSSAGGYAGTGMEKGELEAYLRGVGMMAQDREASRVGRQSAAAQRRARVIGKAAEIQERGAKRSRRAELGGDVLEGLGFKKRAERVRASAPQPAATRGETETLRKAAAGLGRLGFDRPAAAVRGVAEDQRALVAAYLRGVEPLFRFEQDRAAGKSAEQMNVLADDDRWAREAAIAGGIDPAMALGLFPSAPDDVAAKMADLEEQRNVALTGHPDGELGAMRDALSEARVREDYAELMGGGSSDPALAQYEDAAAELYGDSKPDAAEDLMYLEALVSDTIVEGSYLEDAIPLVEEEIGRPLTIDEIQWLGSRFPESVQDALRGRQTVESG